MPDATAFELKRGFHYINLFLGRGKKKKSCHAAVLNNSLKCGLAEFQ